MPVILGTVVVLVCVFGGYVLSHGEMAAIWQPYELIIIGGAALGAFLIANPPKIWMAVLRDTLPVLAGAHLSKSLYLDLLGLMHDLLNKIRREGLIAVEDDIEQPEASGVFSAYPSVLKDARATSFLTDYLRLMVSGNMTAHELESLMDAEIETQQEELLMPSHAVNTVSDALPGFGIVAAVLGIVITMGYLGGDPKDLGTHVAAALVGTFLGVLLAYGFVGPFAKAMEHQAMDKVKFLECIKVCLLASINGAPPSVSVEFGRKVIFVSERPDFKELDDFLRGR